MGAALSTIKITDGKVTADLLDDSDYILENDSYAPAVATRRKLHLAGLSVFRDVEEEITILVVGSTGADCLANLGKLAQLLDQADQFNAGEKVTPVKYQIRAQGSNLGIQETLILGRIEDAESWMGLPTSYNDNLFRYEIGPVRLQFVRRGELLDSGSAERESSSSLSNPAILETTAFSNEAVIATPLLIELDGFTGTTLSPGTYGYLLLTNAANKLKLLEAEDASVSFPGGGGSFGVNAIAAASGGEVRVTGGISSVFGDWELEWTLSGLDTSIRSWYVFYSIQIGDIDDLVWTWRAELDDGPSTKRVSPTETLIFAEASHPKILVAELLMTQETPDKLRLIFTTTETDGNGWLEIDYAVLMGLDANGHIVTLENFNTNSALETILTIDHNILTDKGPSFYEKVNLVPNHIAYKGDIMVQMEGTKVAGILIGNTDTHWRIVNGSASIASNSLDATRKMAYLVPE